jgi:hypothetical protein
MSQKVTLVTVPVMVSKGMMVPDFGFFRSIDLVQATSSTYLCIFESELKRTSSRFRKSEN